MSNVNKLIKKNNFYGFRLIFVAIVSLITLIMFAFVYISASYFLGVDNIIFLAVMLGLSFSFIISNSLVNDYPSSISNKIYHLSCIINGTVFYLFLANIFLWVLNIFNSYFPFNLNLYNISLLAYIFVVILNIYGLYNANNIKIKKVIIQIKNLPDIWLDKTAAFISDTHYGAIYNKSSATKLVKIINKINPDFLFHTGDFFDGPEMDWNSAAGEYKNINIKTKKYFVSGNHDEYAEKSIGNAEPVLSAIKNAGFTIIDGKLIAEDGVQIIGVEYARSESVEKIKDNFNRNKYDNNKPSIILKHVPLSTDVISELGADLMLCGHTHNGQIFPFNFLTKKIYKGYNFRLKYNKNLAVYTTSGIGSWGPPQRIGTVSELVVISFVKKYII